MLAFLKCPSALDLHSSFGNSLRELQQIISLPQCSAAACSGVDQNSQTTVIILHKIDPDQTGLSHVSRFKMGDV